MNNKCKRTTSHWLVGLGSLRIGKDSRSSQSEISRRIWEAINGVFDCRRASVCSSRLDTPSIAETSDQLVEFRSDNADSPTQDVMRCIAPVLDIIALMLVSPNITTFMLVSPYTATDCNGSSKNQSSSIPFTIISSKDTASFGASSPSHAPLTTISQCCLYVCFCPLDLLQINR